MRSIIPLFLFVVSVLTADIELPGDEVTLDKELTCSQAKPCVPGVILGVWEPQEVFC